MFKDIPKPAWIAFAFSWILFLTSYLATYSKNEDLYSILFFLNAFIFLALLTISFILICYSFFFQEKRLLIAGILLLFQPTWILVITFSYSLIFD